LLPDQQIFLFILLIAGVASIIAAILLFRRRRAPGAVYYALACISIFTWIIGYIIELYAYDLQNKYIGLQIQYIFGIPYAPALWLLAAINYTSLGKKPFKTTLFAVSIIPILTMFFMITTHKHGFFYYDFRIQEIGNFRFLFKEWGLWFYVNIVFAYAFLTVGTFLLLKSLKRSKQIYKKQTVLFIGGVILPWAANIIYVAGMKSFMPFDITPIAFTLSIIMLGWSIYRYGLFDLVPAAHDKIIEFMEIGLIVTDGYNRIIEVNPYAIKICGKEQILGKHINDIFEKCQTEIDKIPVDKKTEIEINGMIYDLTISIVYDKLGIENGKIFYFNNITDRKQIERKLSESNAAKDKFFSIIAHDLRNPFYGIMGLTEILTDESEEVSDEERQEIIKEIKDLAANTYSMLDNLLDWSRQQTGKIPFNPEFISLKNIIEQNLLQLKKSAELKKIKLDSEIQFNGEVFADKNMLNTVLRNIISNAIKFTQQAGSITIRDVIKNNFVEIIVADNGNGMDDKTLAQIFKIDKTINSIGTAGERGTGLGLVLCKEFIEKNGGEIWVDSTLGKGSIFTFSIPIKPLKVDQKSF